MSKRRLNGDGAISQRTDGRWEARLSLPDGKRKSFYGKTRDEVNKKLKQAQREAEQGLLITTSSQTLAQFSQAWLEMIQPQIEYGTWKNYDEKMRLHILPTLGKVRLDKISTLQVELLYARKIKEGLSPVTIRHIHTVLRKALQDAIRLGLIARNVVALAKPPKNKGKDIKPFSVEESKLFLSTVEGNRYEALYVLALTTGMREAELLGLRWQDIDFEHGFLQIRQTAKYLADKKLGLKEPKTPHSRRRIALASMAIEALRAHRIRQVHERLAAGTMWDGTYDLVFPNSHGKILQHCHLTQRNFKGSLRQAGLNESFRFHDLRHTAATMLLSRGVNIKVVSEMLGHASVAITLTIYAHILPDMQQAAAEMMDILLGNKELSSKLSSR